MPGRSWSLSDARGGHFGAVAGHRSGSLGCTRIDHVIYATRDLDQAAARMASELGLNTVAGGRHTQLGTHNRIAPLGDGSFIELLALADHDEATNSLVGAALESAIADGGDRLFGWAVAVCDLDAVARRLSIATTQIAREGTSARLAGVAEALAEPFLPFFIERDMQRFGAGAETRARIEWIELAADADKLARWLDGSALGVRLVSGRPGVRAIAVGGRELRTD